MAWAEGALGEGIGELYVAKFFGGDASSGLQSIGQAFRHIDADGSGTLTWDEFEQFASVR